MPISNKLFKSVLAKLDLKATELKQNQNYLKALQNKLNTVKVLQRENQHKVLIKSTKSLINREICSIRYLITISFTKSNTTIQLSESQGYLKVVLNLTSINVSGKQRRQRKLALTRLLQLFMTKVNFLENEHVSVHFNNVRTHKVYILEKLQHFFLIKTIKSFDQLPYNGCRKRKIRRKKYVRTVKK